MSAAPNLSSPARKRLMTVVGARPQFIKAAVVSRALRASEAIEEILVHTGQHYDAAMSEVFFRELEIPAPRHHLNLGPDLPGLQLAHLIERLAPVLEQERPDAVMVYGDTNSTLAAALAAAQHDVPVIHVEAGERIYRRRRVPEETNRVLTDNIAALNLTSTRRAQDHLRREGMAPERARFVGDPLYDLFRRVLPRIESLAALSPEALGLPPGGYHLATIHRAQNTAGREVLPGLLAALDASAWPVVLPLHPRVRKLLDAWGWHPSGNLRFIEPIGYFDFIRLLRDCRCVFTDSGGVTREAFFARRPCVIPMENCWWADIVESGWAVAVPPERDAILGHLDHFTPAVEYPEGLFGDAQAAERIVAEIESFLLSERPEGSWHKHGNFGDLPPARATGFRTAAYRAMLEHMQGRGYAFAPFGEAQALLGQGGAFVLLRHDLDCEVERALPLARIEAELGIRATYFFMIRNDLYNLFSESGTRIAREILALGHGLGLHFDMAAYPELTEPAAFADVCRREAELLAEWLGAPVEAVSFHRPNPLALAGDPALTDPYPHTYMPLFTREIQYYSDSQGRWKHGSPLESEAFREGKPLHVLVHPVWWNETPVAPYETLLRLIDGKAEALERSLARNNGVYRVGRLRDLCEGGE